MLRRSILERLDLRPDRLVAARFLIGFLQTRLVMFPTPEKKEKIDAKPCGNATKPNWELQLDQFSPCFNEVIVLFFPKMSNFCKIAKKKKKSVSNDEGLRHNGQMVTHCQRCAAESVA